MMIAAVVAEEHAEPECFKTFKEVAAKYVIPGDVRMLINDTDDGEQAFNDPDAGLLEAVELSGGPEFGCKQFGKFFQENKAKLECMKEVVRDEEDYPSELVTDMRVDWNANRLFKTMIVCQKYI